jgi:hypothetical protein
MTGYTVHLVVFRSFPGLVIGPHDVAAVAEGGAHAVKEQTCKKNERRCPGNDEEDIKPGMQMEMNSNPVRKSSGLLVFLTGLFQPGLSFRQ